MRERIKLPFFLYSYFYQISFQKVSPVRRLKGKEPFADKLHQLLIRDYIVVDQLTMKFYATPKNYFINNHAINNYSLHPPLFFSLSFYRGCQIRLQKYKLLLDGSKETQEIKHFLLFTGHLDFRNPT